MTLHHDAAALWLQIERNLEGLPFYRLGVQASRDAVMVDFQPPGPAMDRVENAYATDAGCDVPVRIYVPPRRSTGPVVVYVHGGGWSIGSLDGVDATCRTLAARTGYAVVSVDYRQAPEHPYPAPFDDVWTVLSWLSAGESGLDVDPERIALAGDSAGGNLVCAVAWRAMAEGGPRVTAQLLVYPALDDALELPSFTTFANAPVLTTQDVAWFWELYLGDAAQSGTGTLYARPALCDRIGELPPTAILTAEQDPVRDDGEEFARRLKDAGVTVWSKRYPGVYHGFFTLPGLLASADEALRDASDFLTSTLAPISCGQAPCPAGIPSSSSECRHV